MRSRFPNAKTPFNRFLLSQSPSSDKNLVTNYFRFHFRWSCPDISQHWYTSTQMLMRNPAGFLSQFPAISGPESWLPRGVGCAGLCQLFQIVSARRQAKCATHCFLQLNTILLEVIFWQKITFERFHSKHAESKLKYKDGEAVWIFKGIVHNFFIFGQDSYFG